jgi:hypothetical protein
MAMSNLLVPSCYFTTVLRHDSELLDNCVVLGDEQSTCTGVSSVLGPGQSKRHGAKVTFMMKLAQYIICFAVRSQPDDLDDECDPRERWIGEADKLKRMPTVWFEQDVKAWIQVEALRLDRR